MTPMNLLGTLARHLTNFSIDIVNFVLDVPPMIQKSTFSCRASRLTATMSAVFSRKYLLGSGGWMVSPPGAFPNIPLQAISM